MPKQRQTYPLLGMTCAACVRKIEKVLEKTRGIEDVSVNYASESAAISYDDEIIDIKAIKDIIKDLGYELLT
jgi:copper chaperone CopZ